MNEIIINPVTLDNEKQRQAMLAIIVTNASPHVGDWVKLRHQDVIKLNDNSDEQYGLRNSVYVKSLGNNKYRCYVVSRNYPKGSFCKVPDILHVFDVDANNTQQPITTVELLRPLVFVRPYSIDKKPLRPQKTRDFDPEGTLFAPRLDEGEEPPSFIEQAELAKGKVVAPFFYFRYFQKLMRANLLQENTLAALRDLGDDTDVEEVAVETNKKREDGFMACARKVGIIMPKIGDYDLDSKDFSEYKDEQLQSIALTLCLSVQRLHVVERIHRDIKPANIRIGEVNGKLVANLIDYGMNCRANTIQDLAGSPAYIPGEAWVPYAKRDYTIDIYALSLTLFRLIMAKDKKKFHRKCLEHHPPHLRGNMHYRQRTYDEINGNIKDIDELPGEHWVDLYKLIVQGLDPDPEKRPSLDAFITVCGRLPANTPSSRPLRMLTA